MTQAPTVPTRSPMFDGTPFAPLSRPWLGFFNKLTALGGVEFLEDTHQNRLVNYAGGGYADGTLFRETDTGVLYQAYQGAWILPACPPALQDTHANRLANYPAANYPPGTFFRETDTTALYLTYGGAWVPAGALPTIEDTHAHRLANYPAANYPVGTQFFETNTTQTDREVTYIIQVVSGANQWVYQSGVYTNTFANRPTGLGTNDAGFTFLSSDYTVEERWSGTAWTYVAGATRSTWSILTTLAALLTASEAGWPVKESTYGHAMVWTGGGWNFDSGDVGSRFVQMSCDGNAPQGAGSVGTNGWYPCDGGTYTVLNHDGTTSNFTTDNMNGSFGMITTNGYVAGLFAGSAPTDSSGVLVSIGNDTDAGWDSAGSGSDLCAKNPHTHTPTVTQAVHNIPSVANGGLPPYWRRSFWLKA
jgi:hypothetical protein